MRTRITTWAHRRWLVPAAILGLAFILRLWRLGDSNLWWDEALAIWAVRKGFVGVTVWTAGDVHPPLYFWSLWAWVSALGESEFAMRLLSVAFGVLTVAAVYALAHRVAGKRAAIVASLLTAIAPFHVWWSQEMRMYILAGLLCVLSLYALIRWLDDERDDSPRQGRLSPWFWAYIAATTASLYTIFLVGIVVVAQNIAVLIALFSGRYNRKRLFWRWVLAELAVGVLVAIWLIFSWDRMQTWSVSTPTTLTFVAKLYAILLGTGVSVNIDAVWWGAVPLLATLLAGGIIALLPLIRKELRWSHVVAIGLSGFLPVLFVYAATLPRSIFYTPNIEARYLLPFAPMVWVMAGWAVELISKYWRRVGLVAGVVVVLVSASFLPRYYNGRVLNDELQSMARCILSQAEPRDVVLLDSGSRYPVFLYYYDGLEYEGERPDVLWAPELSLATSAEANVTTLQALVGDAQRIWLAEVETNLTDPDGVARTWLDENYTQILSEAYSYNGLTLYAREAEAVSLNLESYSPQYNVADTSLGGGVLAGWEMPVDEFMPECYVHIALLWQQEPTEAVSIELLTSDGQLIATQALEPGARQQVDWAIDEGWPSGKYQIRVSAGDEVVELGTLRVVYTASLAKEILSTASMPCFDDAACLRGYALTDGDGNAVSTAHAGDVLILDLVWEAGEPQQELVVFSHLLGEAFNPATAGPVWGQSDAIPAGGAVSALDWQVGDLVLDRHIIQIDASAPAGEYTIEIGLYSAADGARLTIADSDSAQDSWVLPLTVVIN